MKLRIGTLTAQWQPMSRKEFNIRAGVYAVCGALLLGLSFSDSANGTRSGVYTCDNPSTGEKVGFHSDSVKILNDAANKAQIQVTDSASGEIRKLATDGSWNCVSPGGERGTFLQP